MKLSDRIKELRTQHGYSQDEMAKRAGLSLRTIQRIELNETEPRGDSLIRIAGVFNLKPGDLLISEKSVNSNFIPLLSFSALTFLFFPLLGFLTPLLIWLFRNDKSGTEKSAGRSLLNFQLTWCLITFTIYILGFLGQLPQIGAFGRPETMLLSLLVLYTLNFILILFNIFLSVKGKNIFYQPAIPFLR